MASLRGTRFLKRATIVPIAVLAAMLQAFLLFFAIGGGHTRHSPGASAALALASADCGAPAHRGETPPPFCPLRPRAPPSSPEPARRIDDITKTNVQVTDPTNANNTLAIGKAHSRGFELDLIGRVDDNWSVIANYTHDDVRTVVGTATDPLTAFSRQIAVLVSSSARCAWSSDRASLGEEGDLRAAAKNLSSRGSFLAYSFV